MLLEECGRTRTSRGFSGSAFNQKSSTKLYYKLCFWRDLPITLALGFKNRPFQKGRTVLKAWGNRRVQGPRFWGKGPPLRPGHQNVSMSDTQWTLAKLVRRLRGNRMIEIKTRSRIHIHHEGFRSTKKYKKMRCFWTWVQSIQIFDSSGKCRWGIGWNQHCSGQPELVLMSILYKCVCLLFSRFSCNMVHHLQN